MFKGSRNKEGDLEESKAALERVKDKKKKLEAKFEIASRQPAYLKGRAEVKEELENTLVGIPFDVVPVYSGQGRKRIMTGRIKALFSLTARGAPPSTEDAALLEAMTPQDHVVRLYVLRGKSLMPMDAGGYSDPYLRVSLGRRTISHRSQHLKDVSNANFYDYFEFKTSLPGESTLTIECFDWDEFSRDDLIGVTEIDLEDRVCCPLWQQEMSSRPPVEWRSLYSTHSRNEQGQLELWCDILPAAVADELPPFDIKPPPPQKWELRVICWKAKEVISDDYSGLSDLYCEFRFAGGKPTATDTHFRAKNGKASWNWRIKFPVELDAFSKDKRLTVQLWDRDIGSNDYYGSASISLDKWLRRIFRRRLEVHQYWMPEDPLKSEREEQELAGITGQAFENLTELAETVLDKESAPLIGSTPDEELLDTRFWCPMHNADGVVKGQVLLSIEAVPAQEMDSRKAGHGRKEPNENPQLPKPVGRLKFTLNPCVMVYSLLGPRLCRQLSCVLCILLLILLLYYMIPVVFGEGLYNIIADLFDDIF